MKKLVSLLLVLLMIFSFGFNLISCAKDGDDKNPNISDNGNNNSDNNSDTDKKDEEPKIKIPPYKDYGRDTVNFDKLTYARPNVLAIINAFENVTKDVKENTLAFSEQLNRITGLEDSYEEFYTMYTISEINNLKDSSNKFWSDEYAYLSLNESMLLQTVEKLFVAAAKSQNAKKFEDEYFGAGFISEYADGGIYTDEVVALLNKESKLETKYKNFSTANIIVTYEYYEYNKETSKTEKKQKTDTVDNLLKEIAGKYGENSDKYFKTKVLLYNLYQSEKAIQTEDVYVELVKVRRQIADALKINSYLDYAYKEMGHDYSQSQFKEFINNIKTYVLPVANYLENAVFNGFFYVNRAVDLNRVDMINNLYTVYGEMDKEIQDIYGYMLQHGLFDINEEKDNRFSGAFTTYIENNNSPFIFITTSEKSSDYITLAHEFGHFVDGYQNFNSDTSLDLSEISSQGLEFLTLLKLKCKISDDNYKYLEYSILQNAFDVLIQQGFLASFEHFVYDINYEEISEESITQAIRNAKTSIFGQQLDVDLPNIFIPHTVLYPGYVQSYCTSLTVALEIYFKEINSPGSGIKIYKDLVKRSNENLTFEENLIRAGLKSPFEDLRLKEIADNIHLRITGTHYFHECENNITAA